VLCVVCSVQCSVFRGLGSESYLGALCRDQEVAISLVDDDEVSGLDNASLHPLRYSLGFRV
jgi:hypothetical protein